ncbi:hypothetical protein BKA65DRAFT_66079 [Rhexocercosporidium sp. MPI-PUGE-AT-0058]|nr:hypothetical protein BKA65DRAFT_66079 [Rhexocercosporidium sp. MPI-PUGE-AT-0058]
MKTLSLHLHLLALYASILAIATSTHPPQEPLLVADKYTIVDPRVSHVSGHNNATFGPVPKDEQLFVVELLEIAPTPIQTDRVVFVYLSSWIPPEIPFLNIESPDLGLVNATLKVSSSAKFPDGSSDPLRSMTIPFKSTSFSRMAHLVTREESGKQVDYMPATGGDVLLDFDFQIPRIYLKTGEWTFQVDVRLADEEDTCLFALELVQCLEGDGK